MYMARREKGLMSIINEKMRMETPATTSGSSNRRRMIYVINEGTLSLVRDYRLLLHQPNWRREGLSE